MKKKISDEMFTKTLSQLHPNLITLSPYNGSKNEITVKCQKHNYIFKTKPNYLISGRGCKYCGKEISKEKLTKSIENVILDFKKIHNDKYTYPNIVTEYENNKSSITFVCPVHGERKIKAIKHLQGQGCSLCSHQSYKYSTETFIKQCNKIHNGKYNYDNTEYSNRNHKILIECPIHGEFWQVAKNHLSGCGCPKCKESTLEKETRKILEDNNIKYEYEFKEHTQNNKSVDFYLIDYSTVIECQGEQHFKSVEYFGGETKLKSIVDRDICKYKELNSFKDNIIYITNLNFKDYINLDIFKGIYSNRTFFIEEIINDPSILIDKIKLNSVK